MKLTTKIMSVTAGLVISAAAMANPIVGNWQMSENGQPKAVVQISQSGSTYKGVVISGQTAKAKEFVGKQVLFDVADKGNGKYAGKAKDPRWGFIPAVGADMTLNGNRLTLKTIKGSQTWTRK